MASAGQSTTPQPTDLANIIVEQSLQQMNNKATKRAIAKLRPDWLLTNEAVRVRCRLPTPAAANAAAACNLAHAPTSLVRFRDAA
jgi:hypothetical protein